MDGETGQQTHRQPDTRMPSVWRLLWGELCHCIGLHWTEPAGTGCPLSWCWPRTVAPADLQTPCWASCSPEEEPHKNWAINKRQQPQQLQRYVSETMNITFLIFSHMANKNTEKSPKELAFFKRLHGHAAPKINDNSICSLVSRPLKLFW